MTQERQPRGRYVGQRVSRVDGPAKVKGEATYSAEFGLPKLAHAVLVSATIPHGRVRRIGTEAALAVPGVLDVLTHESEGMKLGKVMSYPLGPAGTAILPLQDDRVQFRGQPIAAVLAESLEAARHAALLLEIEYDAEKFRITLEEGERLGRPLLDKLKVPLPPLHHNRGHTARALKTAAVRLDARYDTPVQHHNPMEMHAVIAAWEDEEHLSLYEPTQWLQASQLTLAQALGLKSDNVHVISPYVGGGFGGKATTWPHVLVAVLAARALGRPVKLVLSRAQMFAAVGYRAATRANYRVGLDGAGKLQAMDLQAESQTGPLDLFPEMVGNTPKMLYANENMHLAHTLIRTHAGPNIMMRAPGEAPGSFGLEVLMDELAEQVGMDPLEFRKLNDAPENKDPESGLPYSSKHLRECYERGAEAFGWQKRRPGVGSMRDGRTLIGWGMATASYPVYASAGTARARLCAGGHVEIEAGSHDIGTGTYSILAQIAADELGVDIGQVRVRLGDSRLPKNAYSGGSRTAGSVSNAVQAAASGLRAELTELARAAPDSPLYGAAPVDLEARGGGLYLKGSGRGESYSAILSRSGHDQYEVYRETIPNGGGERNLALLKAGKDSYILGSAGRYARYSSGAVFVEVRVDPDFMTPRVSRVVGAFDIGTVLNAKTAESQLTGGMIWGVGFALHEETRSDPPTGLILNSNLADYLVPVNADIGEVRAIMLDHPDYHSSALGVRGAGEIGITGTVAAVANAIYHATGRRVRETPITLDKLL